MKKIHIAILTNKIDETVADYNARLGEDPCLHIIGKYALWRTEFINISIRYNDDCKSGSIGHLGWEDSTTKEFSQDTDVNGIIWEKFTAIQQAHEINELWPEANYSPIE